MRYLIIVLLLMTGCTTYGEHARFVNGLEYEFTINDLYSNRYHRVISFVEYSGIEKTYKIIHTVKSSENRLTDEITINGVKLIADRKEERRNVDWYMGRYSFDVSRDFLKSLTHDPFVIIAGDSSYKIEGDKFYGFYNFVDWIEYKYEH